jgi:nucleoside-diphosphate-sugar epimerase
VNNILVTGASGFIGRRLCKTLHERNLKFLPVLRHKNPLNEPYSSDSFCIKELDAATNWSQALNKIDTIIHLAARVHVINEQSRDPLTDFRAINVEGTLNLARQASQAGVRRFIFISSVKVNGEQTQFGIPFREDQAPNPQDFYGISKLEAEQGLLAIATETGLEVVIIRPPLVYGPGVKANFNRLILAVKKNIPLPLGSIENIRSFVFVDNLISLILCCINHPMAINQVFFVSDGCDLSTPQLLCYCAQGIGTKIKLLPCPLNLIRFFSWLFKKRSMEQKLCSSLQIDISKARQLLNWTPPISVTEGLKLTVEDVIRKEHE